MFCFSMKASGCGAVGRKGGKVKLLLLTEFDEIFELGKWYCSFLGCPSQCYRAVRRDNTAHILYLRWRWEDPWQGHIVKNAWNEASMSADEAEWSEDIFEEGNLYFEESQVEEAKEALISIWRKEN